MVEVEGRICRVPPIRRFGRHPLTLDLPRTCKQVGNPGFAIVDEAYPYISKRLLTDDSPRLREALRYMIYGKSNVFDVERLIDLLQVGQGPCVVVPSVAGRPKRKFP